eukprot:4768019-Prymnesium_polylepis.1
MHRAARHDALVPRRSTHDALIALRRTGALASWIVSRARTRVDGTSHKGGHRREVALTSRHC